MSIEVREVTRDARALYEDRIRALESGVTYPLGDDRFSIDHGRDYFAFFDRLGELHYFAALDGERVVAVGAGILRDLPDRRGRKLARAWYGCDLKVARDRRGERIPFKMLLPILRTKYPLCRRGYGITMLPPEGSQSQVLRLASRVSILGNAVGANLVLYSLDADAMRSIEPLLRKARGPLSYLSLAGTKDIVLESTGQPMPLLHVQFGPCAQAGVEAPQDGHVHMFCTPDTDSLFEQMTAAGHQPGAKAAILHHGMRHWDWRFVLTSDI